MAKSSEPKKAATKEKVAKVKKAGLSEDRVVDSDSDGEETKKTKSPEKVKKTKEKKKAVSPPPPPAKKAESSEEEEEDSDDLDSDDESTTSESEKVTEKEKASNGVKRKADSSSKGSGSGSDEEQSSSGEEVAEIAQPVAKKAKTQQPSKKTAPSPPPTAAPTPSIPSTAFIPPKNFTPIDSSKTHSSLSSDMVGKQIWHITAPSSLPISEIKAVGLDALTNGSTVLTHKGSEYALAQDASAGNATHSVFLPGKDGYKASSQPVEKTLRLQQKITLPALGEKQARTETGGETAAAAVVSREVGEGVRPQPKGMRMRYKPPGFGLGDAGLGSDDDEEVLEKAFRLPGKKAKKARRESGDAMEGVEATGKDISKEERKKARKEAKAKAAAAGN